MGFDQISGPGIAQPGTVLLNTLSPNGVSSIGDTTSLSLTSFYRYEFILENITPATNNSILQMQIATSGGNFVSGGYVAMITVDSGGQGANQIISDTSTTAMILSGVRSTCTVGNSGLYGATGLVRMVNPASTTHRKIINGALTYLNDTTSGTAALCIAQIGGYWDGNSNAITGVNFLFNSGNIATGTIKIYGLK